MNRATEFDKVLAEYTSEVDHVSRFGEALNRRYDPGLYSQYMGRVQKMRALANQLRVLAGLRPAREETESGSET